MGKYKLSMIMATLVLLLAACGGDNESADTDTTETDTGSEVGETDAPETVEITDMHGTVEVPVNPETVVALDSRAFETLEAWGIELAAAPKTIMHADSGYVSDDSVEDIGNHREPNLELIAAADPDLVIVGQRFGDRYDDIKNLVPNAVVVDLNFDVSEEAATPGENLINGFSEGTRTLGQIFDKNEEAEQLVTEFEESIANAQEAYNGTDTMMAVIVSGGGVNYAAPQSGRVWGPLYEILDWTPALEVEGGTADHQGDEISVEAIAQSNPDWLMVLDRDAATSEASESVPAQDVIDNSPALQNTTAITEDQIVYAPNDTYTNESIQTFIEIFDIITDALSE